MISVAMFSLHFFLTALSSSEASALWDEVLVCINLLVTATTKPYMAVVLWVVQEIQNNIDYDKVRGVRGSARSRRQNVEYLLAMRVA